MENLVIFLSNQQSVSQTWLLKVEHERNPNAQMSVSTLNKLLLTVLWTQKKYTEVNSWLSKTCNVKTNIVLKVIYKSQSPNLTDRHVQGQCLDVTLHKNVKFFFFLSFWCFHFYLLAIFVTWFMNCRIVSSASSW